MFFFYKYIYITLIYIFLFIFLIYFQYWKRSMVTEAFTNKHEIKNLCPHSNFLHMISML